MFQINFTLPRRHRKTGMSKNPLAREVILALCVKLAIIIAAAFFVFGPGQRPKVDAGGVQARLIEPFSQSPLARTISP